ncbi:MAG: hypothetical protein ACUVSQ_00960 [Pseudanabaenaceae cyanobacterium]
MEPTSIAYYFPANPPYFLFGAALAAGLACGRAFEVTLRSLVLEWQRNRSSRTLLTLRGREIWVPYLGITLSVGVFLSAGLEIFGFPPNLAYSVAMVLALGSAWFVWRQLSGLLGELERGGSAALDLDSFFEL